jgi:hypothetical protein
MRLLLPAAIAVMLTVMAVVSYVRGAEVAAGARLEKRSDDAHLTLGLSPRAGGATAAMPAGGRAS